MPRHLIPRERTATPPSSPARPLPHSRDSVSVTVQLCGADFARCASFSAGVADHVRPSTRTSRAGRGVDLNPPVLRPTICRLLPMIDVTQVVLLSVRQELRSEYAELFLDIFCNSPVKVASRSTAGAKAAGQL